jgi:sulfite reductase (NADPH) flavoprotein alpha-component
MPTLDVPTLPETAPFTPEQRAWLNGYLAGLLSADKLVVPTAGPSAPSSVATTPLLMLFGSQTGTAEALAGRLAKEAKKHGFGARAVSMEDHAKINFAEEKRIAVITSTYGDGEMPDNAQAFWEVLKSDAAPRLDHCEFSVLALGDSNYAQFCQAGKNFDARLEELGAKRVQARVDCEVDYEDNAKLWFEGLMVGLSATPAEKTGAAIPTPNAAVEEKVTPVGFSKKNPFPARLKTNRKLNGEGSAKDTRHFEIVLEGSGLSYEVGDALGVMPSNCGEFVQEILDAAGLDGEQAVMTPSGTEKPLRLALTTDFDLKPFITELPPKGISAADLAGRLKKLQPRLYSISSSPKAHPGEVHLTVGVVRFEIGGKLRKGACSTFLAERVSADTPVPVFVHASPGFKIPKDLNAPMIMVGPGTGIAPFRAFLEERRALGATGRNWLLFGDQRSSTDFLYREDLEVWQKDGFLTRFDTAFSRDQAEKVYVQNRMLENAQEMWTWLEAGGYFYVCGEAARMAKDVDAALHKVCEIAGKLDPDGAIAYVKNLKTQKRYCRDVY